MHEDAVEPEVIQESESKENKIVNAFQEIFDDSFEIKLKKISELKDNVSPSTAPEAATIIKEFESKRHDFFGREIGGMMGFTCNEESSVFGIIEDLKRHIEMTDEELSYLHNTCDFKKTPDAYNIDNSQKTITLSIIDYKVRKNIPVARKEAIEKYEKAIAKPIRTLGKCNVEILTVCAQPVQGILDMPESMSEDINNRFDTIKEEEETTRLLEIIVLSSNIFSGLEDRFCKVETFQQLRHTRDFKISVTDGYFTEEVELLMDSLFGKNNEYNYTVDDMFRLSLPKTNYIRLYGLLVEYYDMPFEDENLITELQKIITWLETANEKGKFIKKAYVSLKENDRYFKSYCGLIMDYFNLDKRECIKEIEYCKTMIGKTLWTLYESKVENEVNQLRKLDENSEEILNFSPNVPTPETLKQGLEECRNKIVDEKSKKFVHVGMSQQPFNFYNPTDSNSEEILKISRETKVTLNECKQWKILNEIQNSMSLKKTFIKMEDHWMNDAEKLIDGIALKDKEIFILSRCRNGDDEKKSTVELYSFLKIMDQVTIEECTPEDLLTIQRIAKMSRKDKINSVENVGEHGTKTGILGFSLIPGEDRFFRYKNVITDGDNYCISKQKTKLLKKLNIQNDNTGCEQYLFRAGVSLKSYKKAISMNKKVLTTMDLKLLEEEDHIESAIEYEEEVNLVDTRTRVLDFKCKECSNDAEIWNGWVKDFAKPNFEQASFNTKLKTVINQIASSKAHDELDGVRENLANRMNYFYSSKAFYAAESISQLFEGLMVKSNFNKLNTVAFSYSNSTDTLLVKLPGEKLHNPKKNTPFIFIKCIKKSDLIKRDIKSGVLLDLCNTDYIICKKDFIVMVSRPQRLDVNRINTLSKSEKRLNLAANVLYDTTLNQSAPMDNEQAAIIIGNAYRLALTVSISQMSLRDPLKYLFTLAIADTSDIKGFMTQKFKYHIKSVSDLKLFNDIMSLINEIILKLPDIKKENQSKRPLKMTEDTFMEGGWPDFNIKSPYTGMIYRDIKQLVNEILVNVYFVQKELHNQASNLEKLVEVPLEFEMKLKDSLQTFLNDDELVKKHQESHRCDIRICEEVRLMIRDRFIFTKKTFTKGCEFSYDPDLVMMTTRKRMLNELPKAELIRPKIEATEKLKHPLVMVDTLTSSKSSTKVRFSRFKDENMWIGDINTRKKIRNNQSFDLKKMNRTNDLRQRIIQEFDFIETLNDLKVVKARINTWNSIKYQLQTQDRSKLYGKHELIQSIDNLNKRLKMIFIQIKRQQNTKYIFNEEKFTEKVVMTGKDGFMTNEVPASEFNTYCKNTMDSAVVTETIPVKENIYDLIKRLKEVDLGDIDIEKMSVLDICKMALYWKGTSNKSLEYASVIRMFPKGQRTFADREIYILDIISKIRLYYVEHCYKHLDKINEYEAISIPGEAKSYHISNQELDFLISNTQLTTEQPRHEEIRLINHTNIDQSKWSAMDVPLKFVDAHFYMMSSKPSERLMMMDIQMDYMVKIISIPESVMQRKMIQHAKSAKVTDLIKKKGPIEICTDGYKRNYSIVTYNWLQGCLNYLSSFVHTCVMEYIKDVHEKYFHSMQEAEGFKKTKCTNFRSMVHSDDGTISSAVVMTDNIAEKFNRVWGSYSRFMFYLTDRMLKYFSINLNLMKTFCSEAIKDFISEFLVNGEFIGNYSRFIVNCCGDSNFKSAKEDLYMLMSSVQSMARRGSSLETLLVAVAVVNYHVYHTYSMAPNEMNDPMRAIRLLKLLQKPENLQKMKRNVMSKSAIEALTRLEGTKFIKNTRIEEDRNKLVTTLGGYCNPPLQLLAILGAKAGDAYILMDSFKQLSLNVQFHEMMANPESLTKTNVNYIIQSIMKQIGLIPDLNILISTFLLRQELGFINGRYSKFDMQRVNHVSLFTFPTMKIEEKFPVKYRSFQDFLTVAQNKNELMKLLLSIVEDSTNIVGKCKNSSHFLTRTKLDYQTTKKIDNYQTTTVATQRLNRLITTNHKVFLPINMLTGLEKIKISESLKAYKEDKLGLVDSKIHIKRAEYDAKRLTIEKFNRMEEFDDIDCYDEIEDLKRIKRELSDLESERAVLRELNDKRINEEKDYVTEIIALMSELSTNKILQEIEDVQKVGLSVTNNQQHYDEISEFEDKYNYMSIEKRDKFTPLRVKMRLNDAIIFMTLIGLYQPIQNLLESFIFTIISTIFNDKMMNYFLKVDIGTRRLNVEAMGIATLQMMVYPYQIRQLTYRAEDVVKGVLMDPGRLEIYIRDIKADETSFKRDMGIVQKIVVDLELQDSIEELKTIMRNYNNSKIVVNDESIFEIMTSIKRYGVLYNLILKTISLYNTKQAYSLSRARRVDIASKYFCDYKGNFIKSEKYVAMIMDHDALRNFHLEILTEHDNSIRSIKKALDAIVMLIEKTKRLIHKEIGPIDIILILKNSNFGKKNMWKYMMDNVEIINKNVHDISGYLPVLYNLGIINQFTVTKTLELNAVMPTWHEAHSVRRELLGDFSVTYRYARMLVYLSGVDRKFKQMVIVKDPVYNDPDNAGYNDRKSFSKIMNKVMKDFRLKPESLTTHKTNIVYMRKDKYRDAEFYRVQNVSDYPRGQLHSFSMVMEVEDKIVSLEESVPQDYAELIDFYDVYEGNRDILNLYAWSIKDMSMFNRESRINRKERSLLLNLDVDYDLINGHARLVYTPAELGVELQGTQSVMSRCIRAKNERLLELDVLSEKSIVINGLNLKFLYEWLRDTDENPKYYGELTHEKILSIAPCLYEFFYTIKALADEEEYSNDAIQTIHEAMMNKVSELVTERLETVVSMDDNDNEIMTPEVYRRVICNSAYQTLNVNILERFPARSMNLKGTIKILIKAILNMKGFRETIVKTGEASGLSDIKINKLLVEIFTLMFMLNDVLLLNSSFIKKLKVKVCQSLFSVTTSLITITYLKLIDTALDSGNIYGQSMSLLNKNYITDLKKLLNNAAVSYTSLLPMTPPEVGTSGPWKRMVQQAFIILTTDNIYNVETSSGEKYTSIIRNKLLEATEVLRCGLLSNDEIKDLETLAKPLEPAKSLR